MPNPIKLIEPMKWRHVARITFTGAFPMDMLRYDSCWPESQTDITAIIKRRGDNTVVRVVKYSPFKQWPFADGRWASFGCHIRPA